MKNKKEFTQGDIVHGIIKQPNGIFTMCYMVYMGVSTTEKGKFDLTYYRTNIHENVDRKRVFRAEDTNKAFKYMEKLIKELGRWKNLNANIVYAK